MSAKKTVLLTLAVFSAFVSFAQKKVLMIGNSFSHSVLVNLPKYAAEGGEDLVLVNMMIPGCVLSRHASNIVEAASNPELKPYNVDRYEGLKRSPRIKANIPEMLAAEKWDVVTIQQGSSKSFDESAYYPWGDILVKEIRRLAPQAKIYFQQTWTYNEVDRCIRARLTDGPGWFGITRDQMYVQIRSAVANFAAKHKIDVIPCGTAVEMFRHRANVERPEDDIVGSWPKPEKGWHDTIHLNAEGHKLQGYVWYKAIFGKDPRELPGKGNVREKIMREVAYDVFSTDPMKVAPAKCHGPFVRWRTIFSDEFKTPMTFAECWKPEKNAPVASKDGKAVFSGDAAMVRNGGVTPGILRVEADFEAQKGVIGMKCDGVVFTISADGEVAAEWTDYKTEKRERRVKNIGRPGARLSLIRDNGGTALYFFMIDGEEFARGDQKEAKPVAKAGAEDDYSPVRFFAQGGGSMDNLVIQVPIFADESPNLVINSSFEHQADGFPLYVSRNGNYDYCNWRKLPYEEFLELMGCDTNEVYSGKYSLRMSAHPYAKGGGFMMKNVATKKGGTGVFSCYMKSDTPGIKVDLRYGDVKTVEVGTEWKRYEMVCTNLPPERSYFSPLTVGFRGKIDKGTVWIDDLQAEFLDAPPAAGELAAGKTFATVYRASEGDKLRFKPQKIERAKGFTIPALPAGVKPGVDLDAWKAQAAASDAFWYNDRKPRNRTEAFFACDAERLYIGMRNYGEVFVPRKEDARTHDNFWVCNPRNCSVEIFLDPNADGKYWQFAFNDSGFVDIGANRNVAWTGEWTNECRENKQAGSTDYFFSIPLSHFASPDIKEAWPVCIGRNDATAGESVSNFASPLGGYHSRERWPLLEMPSEIIARYRTKRVVEAVSSKPVILGRLDYYMLEREAKFRVTWPDGRLEEVAIDISNMPCGTNEVTVAGEKASVIKLPYRAGATQINRFVRCLVHNGKPILHLAPFACDFSLVRAFPADYAKAKAEFYHHHGFRYAHGLFSLDRKSGNFGFLPNSDAFLSKCAELGQPCLVWTSFDTVHKASMAKLSAKERKSMSAAFAVSNAQHVAKIGNYTNITSIIIMDEPELGGFTSRGARSHLREIHPYFPYHPVQMNNTYMGIPNKFADLETEVLMLDAYLTSSENGTVGGVVKQVDVMRKAGEKEGKPCFYFLVGGNFPLHYKEPSYGEQIAQSWGCIASGCTGISWFYGNFLTPGNWRAVKQICAEVTQIEDILLSETLVEPARVSEPLERLRALTRQLDKRLLVATCNISPSPLKKVKVTLPDVVPENGRVKVLFENRWINYRNRSFFDRYDSYQRHVYETAVK